MSHVHSDSEMMLAAQIAYLDFKGDNNNVGEKVDNILSYYGEQDANGNWVLKPEYSGEDALSKKAKSEFDSARSIVEIAEKSGAGDDWRNWNVVDVCNDQNDTGYYGMLIDTGDGNAIIGSRGSESTDVSTGYKDWAEADLGLLDSTMTKQQERAEKYMEHLYYKYGDDYNKFTVGGHSLGGNLATHMTITAPAGMIEKIDHCTSLDGPGFSEEYIEKHKYEIERTKSLLDHYQWSVVGTLLTPIPGSRVETIESRESSDGNIFSKEFSKHSLANVAYTEKGEFKQGDQSALANAIDKMAKHIDSMGIEAVYLAGNTQGLVALYYNLAVIVKVLSLAIRGFDALKKSLKEMANNIYYNYIAPQVSGTYEVNKRSLCTMAKEIEALERGLGQLSDEIDTIRRNLKFWAISGGYYRSNILIIRNGLESDLKKLKKMAQIANEASTRYHSADGQVRDMFA